jgi:hypothetical protein
MILVFVILGVALLVVGAFIPPPGKNIANICGAVLLVIGVVLLLFSLAGAPVVAW